jgi:hypothetical protein
MGVDNAGGETYIALIIQTTPTVITFIFTRIIAFIETRAIRISVMGTTTKIFQGPRRWARLLLLMDLVSMFRSIEAKGSDALRQAEQPAPADQKVDLPQHPILRFPQRRNLAHRGCRAEHFL